jgi:hypothetical protein
MRSSSRLFCGINDDFRELLDKYLTAYTHKNFEALPPRSPDLNLNRCLLNLLSAIRSYLDYVETKRKYGDASSSITRFKKSCSDAYDNSFSYRFLYRFRNYAQHCGLPLTRAFSNAETTEHGSESVHRSLEVGIHRDELLAAKFNLGKLKTEFANQPSVIDVGKVNLKIQLVPLDLIEDVFDQRFAILFENEL